MDFEVEQWRCVMTKNKEQLKIEDNGDEKYYHRKKHTLEYYQVKLNQFPEDKEMVEIVGHLSKKNHLIMSREFDMIA